MATRTMAGPWSKPGTGSFIRSPRWVAGTQHLLLSQVRYSREPDRNGAAEVDACIIVSTRLQLQLHQLLFFPQDFLGGRKGSERE